MMDKTVERPTTESRGSHAEQRREFLKKYGKYAVVVPPAVTLLMASASKKALASGLSDAPPTK